MYTAYGELVEHEGQNDIIFKYNGRSGVITGANGLYYMRARYYNPDIKRFINADVVAGSILDSPSLNRYAYVNGNPISYIDPFGLSAENTEPNDFWHNVLDVIGYMPGPIGTVADLTNAALYAVEGRILEAGIAVGCAIGADLLFKGLKYGYKLAKPVLKTGAEMAGTALKVGVRAIREGTEKLVGSAVRKLSKWSVGEHAKNAFKTTANSIAGNSFVRTVKNKIDTVVKGIKKSSKRVGKPDFYVSPKGDAIPATKEGFNSNLSQMKEVNGKYTGEGSNGPIRVRVEDAHPLDPNFTGHVNPDHYVPHVHIEYKVNGKTGPWGVGGNKISFPQDWLK